MILFFLTILVLILSFLLSRYSDRISRLGIWNRKHQEDQENVLKAGEDVCVCVFVYLKDVDVVVGKKIGFIPK